MEEVLSLLPLKCVIISLLIVVLGSYLTWKSETSKSEVIKEGCFVLALAMELTILFLYFRDVNIWLTKH